MSSDSHVHSMRWKTLGVLSLSLVIIGLDNTILNVAPTLQEEFDASASGLQWMVDSYLLVFAGLLLVFGTLGDRLGRSRALQAGVSIFGLASLGALVADSAGQVIAVRALMGVGAALIMPATLSIIANVFPPAERGKAIGIWAALAALGIGLGPLAGGVLLEWFDWSAVFLVNVPFARGALARHPLQEIVNSLLAAEGIQRSTSYVVLSRPISPRVQPLVDAVGRGRPAPV
jgi:MFS family permease